MSNLQERHLELAAAAWSPAEEALHRQAARLHGDAHLSEHHRRRAIAATELAFDSRAEGTPLAEDADETKHDPSNGQFASGGGTGKKRQDTGQKKGEEGLNDADREHNQLYKRESRIVHRAGDFHVKHSPAREKRGMPHHGVFEDGVMKGHSAHPSREEAVAEANRRHAEKTAGK